MEFTESEELVELRELMAQACPQVEGINTVYLFGSRAKGKPKPKDYDLAVLFDERIVLGSYDMFRKACALERLLEIHIRPLDIVDLNTAGNTLLGQVLKYRKLLYCSDKAYRVEWEVQARYRIWDMQPFHEIYRTAVFKFIEEEARKLDRSPRC